MAAFTSVQTGNWNDGATWGNDSPGAKGTDWPGNAGDTATIANTHVVTYNVSEANALGTVTINSGGELTFHTGMDTLLTLGNVDFTVNGILKIGTVASPIGAAYTATVDHQSITASSELIAGASSEVHICGDPDYFGSVHMATLVADWTADQTFTVAGDITGDWNAGDTLILIKDGEFSSQATDCPIVTIDTIAINGANTDITINEAFPGGTYSIDAYIFHVERNVNYCLNGSLSHVTLNSSDSSSGDIDLDGGGLVVIDSARIGWGYKFNINYATINLAVIHNFYISSTMDICDITDTIVACLASFSSLTSCIGDDLTFIECYGGGAFNHTVMKNLRFINHNNIAWANYSSNCYLQVEIFKCASGYNAPVNMHVLENFIITGHFGQNANGLSYWVNDQLIFFAAFTFGGLRMHIKDFHSPATTVANMDTICNPYRNAASYPNNSIFIEALNGDRTDPIALLSCGTGSLVDADGTDGNPEQRSGGHDRVWKMYILSQGLDRKMSVQVPVKFSYFIESPPETLTFRLYFQSNNVGNINYLIKAVQNGLVSYSEGVITPRDDDEDWDQYAEISGTFSVDGWVDIDCVIWGYESGKFIWVDPLITVT